MMRQLDVAVSGYSPDESNWPEFLYDGPRMLFMGYLELPKSLRVYYES